MSYYGYRVLGKTPELLVQRRNALDWYANLAQISQLILHLIIPFCESVANVPVKPSAGKYRQKGRGVMLARVTKGMNSMLGTKVVKGYGTYGQWIFGLAWTTWLAILCIAETAPDYLHLTKRFGLIAASQLPIHYLLSMPHPYSPFRLLLKSPCTLNMSLHKVTGRIIIAFFAVHISLYSICFVEMGIFWESVRHLHIVVAVVSAGILLVLGITAMGFFRRKNYWWFYRIHVTGSAVMLPLLYFHVKYIRLYLIECAMVVVMNAVLRMLGSRKS